MMAILKQAMPDFSVMFESADTAIQEISKMQTLLENSYLGMNRVKVEPYGGVADVTVKAGSVFEWNGLICNVNADCNLGSSDGGWFVYFDGESFSLSTVIPAWVGTKYGFYNEDSRALFSYAIGVLYGYDTFYCRDASNLNVGTVPVERLPSIDADKLDGQDGSYYQNASNLNAGTVPAARLGGSPTFSGMYFTGPVYPRINPVSGSHTSDSDDIYTPERGWYSFSRDNKVFGVFASGPYSGATRLPNETTSTSTSITIYYKKY
jgi:hypothetical protein